MNASEHATMDIVHLNPASPKLASTDPIQSPQSEEDASQNASALRFTASPVSSANLAGQVLLGAGSSEAHTMDEELAQPLANQDQPDEEGAAPTVAPAEEDQDAESASRVLPSKLRRGKAKPPSPLRDSDKPLGRRVAKPEAGAFAKFARCRVDEVHSSAMDEAPCLARHVRLSFNSGGASSGSLPPRMAGIQKPGRRGRGGRRGGRRSNGASAFASVMHGMPLEVTLLLSHLERFRRVRAFSRAQFQVKLRLRHTERLSMIFGILPMLPWQESPAPLDTIPHSLAGGSIATVSPPVASPKPDRRPPEVPTSLSHAQGTAQHLPEWMHEERAPHPPPSFGVDTQGMCGSSWLTPPLESTSSTAWHMMRPPIASMPIPRAVRPPLSQPHGFKPCACFMGYRPGYVFKTGAMGLGYYWDHAGLASTQ